MSRPTFLESYELEDAHAPYTCSMCCGEYDPRERDQGLCDGCEELAETIESIGEFEE